MGTCKVKLTVAYDGTNYAGWQVQKVGLGVQQRIEEAFATLYGTPFRVHASSRTDAGVHARGMVAHVEIPRERFLIPVRKLALALNACLPEDIRISDVTETDPSFHARYDAHGKQYRYFVWNHRAHNPLLRHTAWHVPQALDDYAMREGAQILTGRHDFKSFANTREYEMESTVRTVTRLNLRRSGPQIVFLIEGDGFLYKMCRGLVGTLVQIGHGKLTAPDLHQILRRRDRRVAGMTAPAHGLILWKVHYP